MPLHIYSLLPRLLACLYSGHQLLQHPSPLLRPREQPRHITPSSFSNSSLQPVPAPRPLRLAICQVDTHLSGCA